jgi:hypothetical protein
MFHNGLPLLDPIHFVAPPQIVSFQRHATSWVKLLVEEGIMDLVLHWIQIVIVISTQSGANTGLPVVLLPGTDPTAVLLSCGLI